MQKLKASLTNVGYTMKDVTHVLATHYHMDHGAIAQELKDKGVRLIVTENQRTHLNDQTKFIRPPMIYNKIKRGQYSAEAQRCRTFLRRLEIDGKVIVRPGTVEDHVTLVLDEGIAFTRDLPPLNGSPEGSEAANYWQRFRARKVNRIYFVHSSLIFH